MSHQSPINVQLMKDSLTDGGSRVFHVTGRFIYIVVTDETELEMSINGGAFFPTKLHMQLDASKLGIDEFRDIVVKRKNGAAGTSTIWFWVSDVPMNIQTFRVNNTVTTRSGGTRTHGNGTANDTEAQIANAGNAWQFKNTGSNTIYLGSNTGVSTSDYPVEPGETVWGDDGDDLFIICDSGLTSTYNYWIAS